MTLPPITDEDRQLLHYNPNTDDIVAWVQAYAERAVAAEREACAQVCEGPVAAEDWDGSYWLEATKACAAAIRARSAV